MNALVFKTRWERLLSCHHEAQEEPLLRPIAESSSGEAKIITYNHTSSMGWAVAFHPEGVMAKAYDLEEITPFTFADVRPQFVLPDWAFGIYSDPLWNAEHTTSFRFARTGAKNWEAPWLALPWLPIDAHALLDPTDDAIHFWAAWFGRPDLTSMWIDRVNAPD